MVVVGKGNLLNYIKSLNLTDSFGDNLTGNYIRLNSSSKNYISKGFNFMNREEFPRKHILRSDVTCEDGFGSSFAGLFESIILKDNSKESLELASNKIKNRLELAKLYLNKNLSDLDFNFEYPKEIDYAKLIALYSQKRNLESKLESAEANFILHQFYNYSPIYICSHPHIENYIMLEKKSSSNSILVNKHDFFIDSMEEDIHISSNEKGLVNQYLKITQNLDSNYVYIMEAGLNPNKIVQIRPFMKKNLDLKTYDLGLFKQNNNNMIILNSRDDYGIYSSSGGFNMEGIDSFRGKVDSLLSNKKVIFYKEVNILEHNMQLVLEHADLFISDFRSIEKLIEINNNLPYTIDVEKNNTFR